GGPVHGGAEVVTVSLAGWPGVKAHANAQRSGGSPRFGIDALLGSQGSSDGVASSGKSGRPTVARTREDPPSIGHEGVVEDLVVTGQGSRHGIGALLPQTARSLEVGEQEGDRGGARRGHFPQVLLMQPHTEGVQYS